MTEKLTCAALDRNLERCNAPTELFCDYCRDGVCVACNLNCLTCGKPLHDDCRGDHRKETGHRTDLPKISSRPLDGSTINNLLDLVDGR